MPIDQNPDESQVAQSLDIAQDPELFAEFLSEAADHLHQIEQNALRLEQEPGARETIHALFRGFHTLKGLAAFLGFKAFRDVCHEIESLLDVARNSEQPIESHVLELVLRCKDYLERELEVVNSGGPASSTGLLSLLEAIRSQGKPEREPRSKPIAPLAALPSAAASTGEEARQREHTETASTAMVRVSLSKLDTLVDMVGEMVIAQSLLVQAGQNTAQRQSREWTQFVRIMASMQKTVMSLRMVAIGHLFQKMGRLVRDLAVKSGKLCELRVAGETTELDRSMVELISDPILHMIRNSVDHGVETPAEREQAGKPATGTVFLSAWHESGSIRIEIRDDGRGLNCERILRKAVSQGLVEPNAQLSEQEIFQLIFLPGFSTAAQVTDVSGRGVGMDVVKRAIQKLRGRIDIQSALGVGTTFSFRLPLTLAIIDGLVVRAAGQRFILPLFAVREMVPFRPELLTRIDTGREVALLRGRAFPFRRLSEQFALFADDTDHSSQILVVVEAESGPYALQVDAVLGKQEVVIKSLGEMFRTISGLAGAAILGDGLVGLILDPENLMQTMPTCLPNATLFADGPTGSAYIN